MPLIKLRKCPYIPNLSGFIMEEHWFLKCFCMYWGDPVFLFHYREDMVYHAGWLLYVEKILHSSEKSHLAMVYNFFYMLLDLICFFGNYSSIFIRHIGLIIFFSCEVLIQFWDQGNIGLIKWIGKYSLPFYFFGRDCK